MPQKTVPRVSACPDDRALLHRAASAKNGYKFVRLWQGNTTDYGGDDSRADIALLSMLLFWTNGDEARGLSKDELTILMQARNAGMDAPLNAARVDEIAESAFLFALKNDTNIDLPTIIGAKRQLLPLLNEIYDSLRPDITLYRHGGGLVSLRDGRISHYTAESMPKLLSARANYVDANNKSMFPPMVVAKSVLFAIDDEDKIHSLNRVTNVPVLRTDGTMLDSPGYDTTSGIYYHPTGETPRISERPTQEDAKTAVAWLIDLLCDFPFESDSDRTNYIGLLLTFVIRELCACVPFALIDAPSPGTGKSLLASIAAITVTGKAAALGVQLGTEEETRKNITSRLRENPSILITDNVDCVIKSPALVAMATAPVWEDRLLGRNRMLRLPVRAVTIFTGNNIRLGGDMPRRCYRVRLDANAARPWMRGGFKYRLPEYAAENRGRIIASLLTMARAWIVAGRPEGCNTILGSFESWCEVVGGILEYSGLAGFLDNLQEMYRDTADGDDDAEQWVDWMDAIHAHFGDHAFTVKELAEAMSGLYAGALKDDSPFSLGEIGKPDDRGWLTRLGAALHARKGQIFNLEKCTVKVSCGIADSRMKKKAYWLSEIAKK